MKKRITTKKIIVFIAIAVFVFYMAYIFVTSYIDVKKKEREIANIEEKISIQEEKNERIQKEIENSDSQEYIEDRARDELGLGYPDEKIYIRK